MSIHIGNLHNDARKTDLENEFRRYGRIKSMWLARSPPGFAFIEFEDTRDAEDAVKGMDGRSILGRRVRVQMKNESSRRDKDKDDGAERPPARDSRKPTRTEHRVLISGLCDGTTWKDLKTLLKEKTEPVYVDLREEGNAVAEFATEGDIAIAIETFSGQDLKGSKINIVKDEKGDAEGSDTWQKFDSRPKRNDRARADGYSRNVAMRGRSRSPIRHRDRSRSPRRRSRDRWNDDRRDRRYNDNRDDRRHRDDRRDRSRSRDRDRGGSDRRRAYSPPHRRD